MTAPAAIQGTYTDLKIVRSRKVCQIVVEIPLEASEGFVKAFGMPNPGAETWVAVARLNAGVAAAGEQQKERRRFDTLPLAQQAAIKCGEPAFWRFLTEVHRAPTTNSDEAATYVRRYCNVVSRSELNHGVEAGERWSKLSNGYDAWRIAA